MQILIHMLKQFCLWTSVTSLLQSWKLQSLLCCQKQPPYKSNLQRIEMGIADGMTSVLGAGRVNFASKKLVTSLGSVATWCTQLFWRRRLRFRVRVGSCIFVTLPRAWQVQGSALQGGQEEAPDTCV